MFLANHGQHNLYQQRITERNITTMPTLIYSLS